MSNGKRRRLEPLHSALPAPANEEQLKQEALKILQSPHFYVLYFETLERTGLVGEDRNAAILLLAGISRLFRHPLNLFIKGQSSAGKNYLAKSVLRLFPKDAVREITSTSATAWNYAKDDFRHRIVYVQERNKASGPVHPVRLLISENKLVRTVTVSEHGHRIVKKFVTRGPITAISTTTKNQLEIDDETRHLSIWIDESDAQSHRILMMQARPRYRLIKHQLRLWRTIHRLIQERATLPVIEPEWFEELAKRVCVLDLRSRRYFPAFLTACKAQALIGSFQPSRDRQAHKEHRIAIDFSDFAVAQILFEPAFASSLHRGNDASYDVRARIERMMRANQGKPVGACALARNMSVSVDRAYKLLRDAHDSGAIQRANKPERGNIKMYCSNPRQEFIPNPDRTFKEIPEVGDYCRFINPITGEWVEYRRPGGSRKQA